MFNVVLCEITNINQNTSCCCHATERLLRALFAVCYRFRGRIWKDEGRRSELVAYFAS
jgi:hypothetical protein